MMKDNEVLLVGELRDESYSPSGNIIHRPESIRFYYSEADTRFYSQNALVQDKTTMVRLKDSSFEPSSPTELQRLVSHLDVILLPYVKKIVHDSVIQVSGSNPLEVLVHCQGLGASHIFFCDSRFVVKLVNGYASFYQGMVRNMLSDVLPVQKLLQMPVHEGLPNGTTSTMVLEYIPGRVAKGDDISLEEMARLHGKIMGVMNSFPPDIKGFLDTKPEIMDPMVLENELGMELRRDYRYELDDILSLDKKIVHGDFRYPNIIISRDGPVIIDLEEIHCAPAILDVAKSSQHIGMSAGVEGVIEYARICNKEYSDFQLNDRLFKASCLLVNANLYNWGYLRELRGIGNHKFNRSVMHFMQHRFNAIKEEFKC